MLHKPSPGRRQRLLAAGALVVLAMTAAGVARAIQPPSPAGFDEGVTSARVSDPDNPNDIAQMEALSREIWAQPGFLRDAGSKAAAAGGPAALVQAVLVRDGRRFEVSETGRNAPYAAILPMSPDAAIAFTLDNPQGDWSVDALVSVEDRPIYRTGRLQFGPGQTHRIQLFDDVELELTLTPKA